MSTAVNKKWKKTFPDTIGNQTRPKTGVDDTQAFETGAFPQVMSNDPVRYDLQNAAMSQAMSNDARLNEKVNNTNKALDAHKVDPKAHATGISGNAATATKVVSTAPAGGSANLVEGTMAANDFARIRISGPGNVGEIAIETADDMDGDTGESIVARKYSGNYVNVIDTAYILDKNGNTTFPKNVISPKFTGALQGNASSASKLAAARTISLTGNATGSVNFDGSGNVAINVNNNYAAKATNDGDGANIAATYVKHDVALSTQDLNTITSSGFYRNSMDANSTTARHYPIGRAGALIVANNSTNGSNSCSQIYMPYNENAIYKRYYVQSSNAWTNWRKAAFEDSNVASASKLAIARTIALAGNATGSTSFDGSGNATINVSVNNAAHAAKADNAGNADKLNGMSLSSSAASGSKYWGYVTCTKTDGVTEVGKYLDWHPVDNGTNYAPRWTAEGNNTVTVGTINGTLNGNASSASKLQTARNIALTGNATGSANFDGSGNISINATVNHAAKLNGFDSAPHAVNLPETTDNKWSIIGTNNGSWLSSIRTGFKTPNWLYGNHSAGIAFGGSDTKGVISLPYNAPAVRFAGGNGTAPVWYFSLSGSNGAGYNLDNFPTKTGGGASGTWGINISGNANTATNANHASTADRATKAINDGNGANIASTYVKKTGDTTTGKITFASTDLNALPEVKKISDDNMSGVRFSSKTKFLGAVGKRLSNGEDLLNLRSDNSSTDIVLDSRNYTNYAPTKTGGGASGTWGINISGNANTATNAAHANSADKVDGYHAADLFRYLGGNKTPVITSIFDRAGTIDMSSMSAADKATHKANINKSSNMTQNLWNSFRGIYAYGGDTSMLNGYASGTLKLTQSYKNFDKILFHFSDDDATIEIFSVWDVFEFQYMMEHAYGFNIGPVDSGNFWEIYGACSKGSNDWKHSTDTILSCCYQNCGIINILGIKY